MNFDYPSPIPDLDFTLYWDRHIDNIVKRDNFKKEHLDQLKVLCQLFVEHDYITQVLKEEGMTYSSEGRNGLQLKPHPLLPQINRTRGEIRAYTRALGIQIVKDQEVKDDTEKSEWD